MNKHYTLIRSARRTLSLEIREDLSVLVRAPKLCPQKDIDRFVLSHEDWIASHIEKRRQHAINNPEPTQQERDTLIRRAVEVLPARTAHFAAIMGVKPSSLKITDARKRYGSCSPTNGICFSWRLMRHLDEAVDYVVVHELAHIVHKNHGKDFHALVEKILPDHKRRRALLKGQLE